MKHWEDICERCGICCYGKLLEGKYLVLCMDDPCEYLDEETKLCTVYENRQSVCPECLKVNLMRAMFSPALPETCAYARFLRRWHLRFVRKREIVIEENSFGR